jgi:hypothetical protein
MNELNKLAQEHVGKADSPLIFLTDSNANVIAVFVKQPDTNWILEVVYLAKRHNLHVEDSSGLVW